MGEAMTQEGFLTRAFIVHGDLYDYSRVVYVRSTDKIELMCRVHGSFWQVVSSHLSGRGCPECKRGKIGAKLKRSVERFVHKAREIHGDKYDYSKVVYEGAHSKVCIVCPEHGEFWQTPAHHLGGCGCPAEKGRRISLTKRSTTDEFRQRALKVHGDLYDYSAVQYVRSADQVGILCQKHGLFMQIANEHLLGRGCPKCGYVERGNALRLTQDEFLSRAKAVHGDVYDYSETVYHAMAERVTIHCKKHGNFWQTPHNHLGGDHGDGNGCPSCVSHYSKGHQEIDALLKSLGEELENNNRRMIAPYELDTYLPKRRLAIEYNGNFWHSIDREEHPSKFRHRDKFNRCTEQGIQLLQIDGHEWSNPLTKNVWISIIKSKLGFHDRRIPARKTEFRQLTSMEANVFLASNHLQGAATSSRWCFALFWEGAIVGLMTFSGHQKTRLNMARMAFALNTTVVGGAGKLFCNALRLLPPLDVITFANQRYSNGNVYETLGFKKESVLPPSYQWYFKGRMMDKRQCRHEHLPKLLGASYDPSLTEHENMFRAGARCLYDAGYQRWAYSK